MQQESKIFVTFKKEGIHKFPAANIDKTYATGDEYDISFLAFPHRHIFHFKVSISVAHSDREIEFIQFKRWLDQLYSNDVLQLDYKSCEMMAEELHEKIIAKYGDRKMEIEVSEDGENGAILKWC